MAFTKTQLVAYALRRLAGGRSEADLAARKDDVESWIPAACHVLALQVAADPTLAAYLSKQYALAFVLGVAPIEDTDILIESLPTAHIVSPSNLFPWIWVPSETDLFYPHPASYIYYTVSRGATGLELVARNTDGSRITLADTATVDTQFIPVVTDDDETTTVPFQLRDMLVDILVSMARARNAPPEKRR